MWTYAVRPKRETVDVEASFAPEPSAARTARSFVGGHVPDDMRSDVELITSELVTNSIEHARTPLTVRVQANKRQVRVEVADSSAVVPALPEFVVDAERGWGLRLVELLSDRWGIEPMGQGKRVWFEIGYR